MNLEIEVRPGRRLHIETNTHSDQKPTAFLIHGLGGSGAQWRKQISLLDPHFNLIIPDLLGHGQSEKPKPNHTNPYSFIEFSQDLECIFEKFSGTENIIMGHSYGGPLAALLAFNHQSKVKQLTLVAPMSCQPRTQIPTIYHLPVFALEWIRPYLEKTFEKNAFAPNDSLELRQTESRAGKNNLLYVIKNTLLGMRDIPVLDMQKLTVPTLLFGGEFDNIVRANLIQEFYKRIPQHQYHLINDAGHLLMLEQPNIVNEFMKDALAL